MKVVFLQDVAGDQAYQAGQQADVSDQLARPWIEQGIARPLDVAGVKAVRNQAHELAPHWYFNWRQIDFR